MSALFYCDVFGAKVDYRDDELVQVKGPGPHDVLAFVKDGKRAGRSAGIAHFGFRLKDPKDIDVAVRDVVKAGGTLVGRGEFGPGLPYAYVRDLDGYEIEVWFE